MAFHSDNSIHYYTFDSFDDAGIPHAIFTRRGGVSLAPWAALNLGGTVGDDPAHVQENRRRAFQAADRAPETLFDVWQVHSREVVRADAPRPLHTPHHRADAIFTDQPAVTLLMRFADCVPVLIADPTRKVVALVHAGWQGTVKRVVAATVEAMLAEYGLRTENLLAGIGPSIARHHYEVGPEVAEQVRAVFGQDAGELLSPGLTSRSAEKRVQFDLWAANRLILEQVGVRRIEVSGICTACHLEDWYSHRGEQGKTGRFGALIAISK